jgi:hypothetical protein
MVYEKLKTDFTRQLAVERAFQAAVESCTDIAAHIVSAYQLRHPQESRDVYQFLIDANYHPLDLTGHLCSARPGGSGVTGPDQGVRGLTGAPIGDRNEQLPQIRPNESTPSLDDP